MRGKLVKPQARILYVLGLFNMLSGGTLIGSFANSHSWLSLSVGIFCTLAGVLVLIQNWFINHPKIAAWAEDSWKGVEK